MSRGPDAGTLLRRALERSADAAGCSIAIGDTGMARWASATFSGARHHIAFTARDDAGLALWVAGLGEADLPLRGHVVADLVVLSVTRGAARAAVALEALTVAA